jgi:hypothetical protein
MVGKWVVMKSLNNAFTMNGGKDRIVETRKPRNVGPINEDISMAVPMGGGCGGLPQVAQKFKLNKFGEAKIDRMKNSGTIILQFLTINEKLCLALIFANIFAIYFYNLAWYTIVKTCLI